MASHESPDSLARGLRAVAEDDEQLRTSSAVGMRLMAEVNRIGRARRRRTVVLSLGAAAALFAAVLISAGPSRVLDEIRGIRAASPDGSRGSDAPVVARELVTEFFPLAYSNVPARSGYVVRMQVPREALASFAGAAALESSNGGSGHVLADVVIGDDGLARAVRFVQVIGSDRQEKTP